MTDREKEVLNFFALVELLTGIWMLSSSINNQNFIRVISIYSPIWILGLIFILGGTVVLVTQKRFLLQFIILVSTPLTFLGLVYLQVVYTNPTYWGACIITLLSGIYSAIYAGKIFPKAKSDK